jgi:hypothetical protein
VVALIVFGFSRIQPRTDPWKLPLSLVLGCIDAETTLGRAAEPKRRWGALPSHGSFTAPKEFCCCPKLLHSN